MICSNLDALKVYVGGNLLDDRHARHRQLRQPAACAVVRRLQLR